MFERLAESNKGIEIINWTVKKRFCLSIPELKVIINMKTVIDNDKRTLLSVILECKAGLLLLLLKKNTSF